MSAAGPARLLYVVPAARFFVTHRMALALRAKAAGYDVHVATPDGDEVATILAAGLQWHRVRFGPLRQKPWSDLESLIDLIRLNRRLRPTLVHHVTFKAVLYGTIAARLSGARGVVNAMTGLGDVFDGQTVSDRFWMRLTIALFRTFVRHERMRVIVQNPDDLNLLVHAGAVRKDQARLIRGSGVDPDWFAPVPRPDPAVPAVMFVGRVVSSKGVPEFVEAARRLRGEGVRARFLIAGEIDRESGHALSLARIEEWQREGSIEYLGFYRDPRPLYAMADVICLPSHREGLPKALLEAASCALPIVTADTPGCREIVADGQNGLLVPIRDAVALAAAMRRLISDPALRQRMGAAGRRRVIEDFSLSSVIAQTLAVYDEILREDAATARSRVPASDG